MKNQEKNITFIDGQNLHMSITKSSNAWSLDLERFNVYLKNKLNSTTSYYYLGFYQDDENSLALYERIQKAGFILCFRKHNHRMMGKKKGNVDPDIIFSIMKKMYKKEPFNKIVLVSGDGDYKMLVDFLIEEDKFEKIIFPNKERSSSLYKSLSNKYFINLSDNDIKNKVRVQNEKGALGN